MTAKRIARQSVSDAFVWWMFRHPFIWMPAAILSMATAAWLTNRESEFEGAFTTGSFLLIIMATAQLTRTRLNKWIARHELLFGSIWVPGVLFLVFGVVFPLTLWAWTGHWQGLWAILKG